MDEAKKSNIALIGGRGSGKTTVAQALGARLHHPVLVFDEMIEQKAGQSISSLVKVYGWPYFRELEYRVLQEAATSGNAVWDCGGGIVCEQDEFGRQSLSLRKVSILRNFSLVIFLDTPVLVQQQRLAADSGGRPPITSADLVVEVQKVMALRHPWYRQACHVHLKTEGKAVDQIVREIQTLLKGPDMTREHDPVTEQWRSLVSEAPSGATVCAVIGDPVEHSVSPAMHTAGYRSLGLKYYFGRLRVTSSELARSMAAVRSLTIRGVSVTLPHKVAVMQYLDEIDPVAQQIGAVNTIVNTSGHLKGYNTDWEGAMRSVEEVASIAGKTVVMIGAGGAARGVGYGFLQRLAGRLIILNRSEEKAKALAGELGAQWGGLDQLERSLGQADILFQTTSVGMHPDILETIVPQEFLHPGLVVVEAVFNPLETRLIREAKAAGCKVSLGYRMLLYQGVRQFELYTGVEKAPVEAMDKALVETLKNR